MSERLRLLDTTLRDGSYAIDFQFTARDTAAIAGQLEAAGFELIEIGHGVGLGASQRNYRRAAETDEAYLAAAADTLKRALWGMFCIPGVATLQQIDMAAEFGMRFIRVGTDVADVPDSKDFIERAKKHGMVVCANYMKSYVAAPEEFARNALLSQQYGADVVYIVDSAGGMLTRDMEGYFRAVRDVCDVKIGFHGHDNLGLGVANAVRAAELGAAIVDTSLQGMGRSAGNTPTELFIVVMERLGVAMGFDPLRVMDIGEKYIKPLIRRDGLNSLDIVAGFAQFHSSYMTLIREYSSKFGVDPRKLIIALCERDKVNAPRTIVEDLAHALKAEPEDAFSARFQLDRYYGAEQNPHPRKS
ncbi:4-hydroxy-2-oxovalerate aldolase [Mesorhizobium sp. M2A.F.Ca.ET.067.02.1.1]|uniref:4-hydroxy-2-oxovalerate aldolase n=1 Tax=Mesorhizobium sp. M2A.F.Ca.ET.067.02.1.1 TaxID=2496749 RepID=UPI000FD53E0A|nr:4-hydroxy-2-oxovalerate aldolase [Mesorhizobium sp. M2A.F.Ca.ET.067.02.1.1]RUW65039.1 4-hydroxy-2-oxovalerate aldolase [Mesorhizobium sp. M2A.F.Ca.ET.067.02.1.1]TIU55184.1 MAG: 4-hydroxy-2-oxovalerate aldolase [Mesorhizobium sp.]